AINKIIRYLCLVVAIPLIPLYIRVLTALPRSTNTANAVYRIYQVGGVVDIFSLFNTILQLLAEQSLLPQFLVVEETAHLIMALVYGTRMGQLCTVFLISLNRVIAVRLPVHYQRVFENGRTPSGLFILQSFPTLFYSIYFFLTSESTWVPFATGHTVTASFYITRPLDLSCIAIQLFFTVSNIICYCIIIASLRGYVKVSYSNLPLFCVPHRFSRTSRSKRSKNITSTRWQFLYLMYMIVLAVFDVPKEVQLLLFNLLSLVVSSSSPALLFIFSSDVRANLRCSFR
ncbi:hypothetical protein PMAYCL1PPCAC_30264, partial [Pristionchus mayeri]